MALYENEVKNVEAEYSAMINDPGSIIMYDKYLEKGYSHKYHDYNPC